jgi:hypothetical protein
MESTLSCAGGEETVSVTATVCGVAVAAQPCPVHVRVTVPVYGEPVEDSARAALFSPIMMLPGVLDEPETVSQGTDTVDVKFRTAPTLLELTSTEMGCGALEAPATSENDALAAESTTVVMFGPTATLADMVALDAGDCESAP